MQNQEADDVYDKKARFVLFDTNGDQFNEDTIRGKGESSQYLGAKYYVFWYDSKMKTYELFIEHLSKK